MAMHGPHYFSVSGIVHLLLDRYFHGPPKNLEIFSIQLIYVFYSNIRQTFIILIIHFEIMSPKWSKIRPYYKKITLKQIYSPFTNKSFFFDILIYPPNYFYSFLSPLFYTLKFQR